MHKAGAASAGHSSAHLPALAPVRRWLQRCPGQPCRCSPCQPGPGQRMVNACSAANSGRRVVMHVWRRMQAQHTSGMHPPAAEGQPDHNQSGARSADACIAAATCHCISSPTSPPSPGKHRPRVCERQRVRRAGSNCPDHQPLQAALHRQGLLPVRLGAAAQPAVPAGQQSCHTGVHMGRRRPPGGAQPPALLPKKQQNAAGVGRHQGWTGG